MRTHCATLMAVGVLLGAPCGAGAAQELFVYRLSLRTPIDPDVSRVVERAVEAAERRGAAIILDISVTGGSRDIAARTAQRLADASVPVHVLVCGRAVGASTLLVLAADSVFMCPEAMLGGADGVAPEDLAAYGDDLSRMMADRGLDPDLGRAMTDPATRVRGMPRSDDPLILDAALAGRVGVSAATVPGFDSVLTVLGLDDAYVIDADRDWNSTRAEVSNFNWRDVRVFLVRGSSRMRLGTVTSMNSADFEIPEGHLTPGSQIQLLIEAIGSTERFASQRVRVEPGLVLQLDVANVIRQSSFSYYLRN